MEARQHVCPALSYGWQAVIMCNILLHVRERGRRNVVEHRPSLQGCARRSDEPSSTLFRAVQSLPIAFELGKVWLPRVFSN